MEREKRKKGRALIARNMKRLRKERGWSQEELSAQSGIHRTYVSTMERKQRNPSVDVIERLAESFGVPMADLFRETR
ncbi:MAG: helix-turn-helix transcriptional regulator [Betaproteobacteria bacterium]|nr:helix-turn-helix transcriptional regulator [Betaproteobacteria bacterium]